VKEDGVSETVQQYTDRLLSYVKGMDAARVQKATPGRLRRLLRRRTARTLTRPPAPGKWSPAQIVAHLADAEVVHAYRLRMILSRDGTEIQAYDQNLWAESSRYERIPVADSLALFETLRKSNVRLMRSVTPAQRKQYGQHEERGKETLEHLERLYAGHDMNHLMQLERILAK
jgi:DinB family protein